MNIIKGGSSRVDTRWWCARTARRDGMLQQREAHVGMACLAIGACIALLARSRLPRRARSEQSAGRRSRFQDAKALPIFCAESSRAFATTIADFLQPDDVVLEIGCQLNALTTMMSERVKAVVGIDIDRKAPSTALMKAHGFYRQQTQTELRNVSLHIMDMWDLPSLLETCRAAGHGAVTVIVIDANVGLGNDLPLEALTTCRTLSKLLSPRVMAIKSRALAAFQRQLRPAPVNRPDLLAHRRPAIVAANLVHDYRQAALARLHLLREGEVAFEIGAHVGATTALLHEALARVGSCCVGVDVSSAIIERARTLHPGVRPLARSATTASAS